MSLFGKVLAVLNLFGALGLVYLASMGYGVRQQWQYVAQRYELMSDGLPVDDTHPDRQALPAVGNITDDTVKDLFSNVGGNPVKTQVEEVEAVKTRVNTRVQSLENNKRQQAFVLAWVLLQLADSLLERDEYLATLAHLGSDAELKALESRYVAALRDAKKEGASGPDRPFDQAFRLGVRSQGGAPSDALTSLIVEKLPRDPKADVNIAKLFADALETQRQEMLRRLEWHFAEALTNAEQSTSAGADRPKNSRESQRAAIARVLFGLAPSQASDAIEADPNHPQKAKLAGLKFGSAAFIRALAGTDEVKIRQRRVLVVCGVRVALNAITARSAALRLLASQVDAAASDERIQFLSDLSVLLEQARDVADRIRAEEAEISGNVKKLATQQASLMQRTNDVATAKTALADSIAETTKAIEKLRSETERARAARVRARDLLGELSEREKRIQDLERQVREAQGKSR